MTYAKKVELAIKGKTIAEVWTHGDDLEIVFTDGTTIII